MVSLFLRVFAAGFALLAGAGFLVAVVVHVASLAGVNLLGEGFGYLMLLHGGIFVVALPMVAVTLVERMRQRFRTMFGRRGTRVFALLFLYCAAMLAWTAYALASGAAAPGAVATDAPIAVDRTVTVRVFSSGWMLFYFAALSFFTHRCVPAMSQGD